MNNFSILILIIVWFTLLRSSPTLASGFVYYREVKSNNLLQCSTNQQIEINRGGGDASHVGAGHLLICLDGDRQAKWIIYSYLTCQSSNTRSQNCPMSNYLIPGNRANQSQDNSYIFKPSKTGIGFNCKTVKNEDKYGSISYKWSCEKYTAKQNLTIKTKGSDRLQGTRDLFQKYGKIPDIFQLDTSSDNPSCKQSDSCSEDYSELGDSKENPDPRIYTDCRGDAKFCNYYYNLSP
ncbi:hypothetical protein A0J48_018245 [Sphaerospermopsis aphanizomenoides BCCUSP55]|uniref:hypothetical protein n=1 Tax=Sphaerospermopsis aphanizomenoides TaxID=459663 RepID=UPI0019062A1E|nr:hypothetical protein [Sphaerospermopsis aphanizomenoides]MBK1989450.1 hypothetical protein [Sphaerospermopsis aphanizomenoides BCCUSP55]